MVVIGAGRSLARRRASHHRHDCRHGQRRQRHRAARHRHHPRSEQGHVGHVRDRRHRQLHRAVPDTRHLRRRSQRAGLQEMGPRRRDPPGEPARARRRRAGGGGRRGNHDRHGGGAAAAHRFVRGRHRHRGARDQGAAAERPELRGARLPDAGHHARAGRREPVRRQHLQPARRVELQRARPSGQRQRLADRRHRQQRVPRSTP